VTDTPTRGGGEAWAKLRRRKVVQWGIAYAAGAWGLLQGVAYVTATFHWPEQIQRLATIALLIGLPIALVIAWYHGDRGQQRLSAPELTILTLLFLVGGGIFWLYQRGGDTPTTATQPDVEAIPEAATDSRPSIAVLPFENRSASQEDAFFVDGIHDDILMQLSKVSALKVISRTSVERFRKTDLSVQQIAQQLGVRSILEGGVQRAGDRVRIHVQLIDATTDDHLWAESYDRELTSANIFAIQSEVAAAIAGALKTTLTPAEQLRAQRVPTQNLQAWEAYQLGQQRMERRTSADLADAERFFREAIDLDPKFAPAYVGLADTLILQIDYSGAPRESTQSYAEKAVAEALELDPDLAEAWTSSGLIAYNRQQFDRAESMYRRAIELNPNYAPASHWYSMMLGAVGRLDEALAQIQRAAELDPLSGQIKENLGWALERRGSFHEAEAVYRRAITFDPSRPGLYLSLAILNAYAFDRFADAVPLAQKAMELDSDNPGMPDGLALLYFDLGDDTKYFETTAQAAKRWPEFGDVQLQLALISLLRLDAAGAVRHAQRALDANPRYDLALAILRNADLQNGRYDAALARYEQAYPELFVQGGPRIDVSNHRAAIDLALVFQKRGDSDRAGALLDGAARVIRTTPRLGISGYWVADVAIHALRGQKAQALATLREAARVGWRGPLWRYYRDFDPNLASIRNEPQFKAVFADIERDMAAQRAELAARPRDAGTGKNALDFHLSGERHQI
jgi:TolB-like protein/Tfp pilus assembly protein PilF